MRAGDGGAPLPMGRRDAIFAGMKHARIPILFALMLTPLAAQAADAPTPDAAPPTLEDRARRALDLVGKDLESLMRGLGESLERLDDYGPPQVLPNGDILIPRRRPPSPAPDDAPIDL